MQSAKKMTRNDPKIVTLKYGSNFIASDVTCRQVFFGKNYQSNQVNSFLCVLNSFTLMSLCNLPVHFYPRTVS